MNEFNPGDGWEQVPMSVFHDPRRSRDHAVAYVDGERTYWVRVPPVSPLPTEAYTVIRVEWKSGMRPDAQEFVLWDYANVWESEDNLYTPDELAERIAGWEPLAEPRATTAKTVLDRVNELLDGETPWITVLARVAREFGVLS